MEELKTLEKEKVRLETEIDTHVDFLTAEGMPGLTGPLVNSDGFPRPDLDLYAIRHARHRVACLKTDYNDVCQRIHAALTKLHSERRVAVPRSKSQCQSTEEFSATDVPFAWIDEVTPGSSADAAGLQYGDRVVSIGSVRLCSTKDENSNAPGCATVAACFQLLVRQNILPPGVPVPIRILRGVPPVVKDVILIPAVADGQKSGRLGCHLTPL